ncbi:uncharacterized protein Z520_11264 [Fonsecaea multimorphosa CBS 102226]|uniref:Uncharacterized protein n=1 Tax=Fonsecaea multimorphosa CBS 102226 TaxID=1442371 RepID=A0A0D2I6Z4_9EURO|nr:uncharacterized protein Z520_11264 [Fonsecaea multimorphosa CBS 102226]KIX92991.1 hypothetical protein Z520_11264 [Fonsecaea multimorphosa CBS 102226]OAL18239.1 hypothetical protein AYO22_10817 [Fonsecaea multimorphosa]
MTPTTPRSKSGGKYANPTIQIVVGRTKQLFHVHYAYLERTDFFNVHGPPQLPTATTPTPAPKPTRAGSCLNSPAPSEATVTPDRDEIKAEQEMEDEMPESSGASPTATSDAAKAPAYILRSLIHDPAAFEVVVDYLYNTPPSTPQSRSQFRILLKAYILALQYRMSGLQDDLIDCFRNYHASYTIRFAELFWVSGRVGDGEAVCTVPLIQYLIDQVAFEIYQGGYDAFVQENSDFEMFLTNGDRPLRRELFKALAKVAQDKSPLDPALGLNRWRVVDYPNYDRSVGASSNAPDIIDID